MPDEAEQTAIEVVERQEPSAELIQQHVVATSQGTYFDAVEFGKLAAASALFPEARNAARAAIVAAMGMELGIGPAVALNKIHILEHDGKINFIIEGALLGAIIEKRPDVDYKVIESDSTHAELEFLRDGEKVGPNIVWTEERAIRANLWQKSIWKKYPNEMLRWRCLAEGVRIYFPSVLAGGSIYVEGEIDDQRGSLSDALEGPRGPQPLDDERAEELRKQAGDVFAELRELNPKRLLQGRFQSMLQRSAHSHAELENTVKTLGDLVAAETTYQTTIDSLTEVVGEKAAADVVARAERRGSSVERQEVVTAAFITAEESAEGADETGDDDVPTTDE